MAVDKLFAMSKREKGVKFHMSFYEIYGGRVLDLLNNQKRVQILEDGNNFVQIQGILEKEATSPEEMRSIIEYGHAARTTHATVANNTSSRSHAICQIYITQNRKFKGKLILCDLAGSERAQDTQSNSRQRRLEGAKINKSLLALKECIRAMHSKQSHIPFRASKLTLALRDSFMGEGLKSKIVMIACVCPGSSSSDHTINTLRYADRLKMKQNRNIKPMTNQSKGSRNRSGKGSSKGGKRVNSSPKQSRDRLRGAGQAIARSRSRKRNYDSDKEKGQQVKKGYKGGGMLKKSPPKYPGAKDFSAGMDIIDEVGMAGVRKSRSKNKWKERKNAKKAKPPKRNPFKDSDFSDEDADDEEERQRKDRRKGFKQDFDFMKTTLKVENKGEILNDEVFDYQEKADDVLEMHDEILAMHMNLLKVSAFVTNPGRRGVFVQGD